MNTNKRPVAILLVDDDEDDRLLTADAIREISLATELMSVCDGEELMEYLNHQGKFAAPNAAPRPGMILLDLNMPRRDGREALREVKSHPEFKSIPVVVLTTSQREEDIRHTYELGANSFIVKPSTFEELVETLKVTGQYWLKTVELPGGDREY